MHTKGNRMTGGYTKRLALHEGETESNTLHPRKMKHSKHIPSIRR